VGTELQQDACPPVPVLCSPPALFTPSRCDDDGLEHNPGGGNLFELEGNSEFLIIPFFQKACGVKSVSLQFYLFCILNEVEFYGLVVHLITSSTDQIH